MSEYYNIVPWSNSKEWLDLFDKLQPYNTIECKKEALEKLLVWKARCPFLPSGIESTLTLLEIIVKDAMSVSCDAANDQLLRLAYSTAIMRFVNHMFDGETAKGSSLYQAAINLHVPSWVVDLRHDTAHSNSMPTLQLLRDASDISYNWLYEHYWLKHKPFVKDYITNDKVVIEETEYKIGALMNFCVSISVCANIKGINMKNLADIPDAYMQESILKDAHELFGNSYNISNLKTTSISSLINMMTTQSKKLLEAKDAIFHINKALIAEDSLILSLELLNQLDSTAINKKRYLKRLYVQCFDVLLTFLHTNDLLQDFVLELIHFTQNDSSEENKRLLAALWVGEILRALKRNADFADKMKKVTPEKWPKKRKELISLYHHWFPNDKNGVLLLDLQKPLPNDLTNMQFIQPIVSSYNPYLTYFIKDLLLIIQPQLPKAIIQNICKLAELIAVPEKFLVNTPRIYTIDDLKAHKFTNSESDIEDIAPMVASSKNNGKVYHQFGNCETGIWKITKKEKWSACPIGILPWQLNNQEPEFEEMDIT